MRRLVMALLIAGCAPQTVVTHSPANDSEVARVCPIPERDATVEETADPAASAPEATKGETILLLQNARLIDGTGEPARDDVDVLIRGRRIAEIGTDLSAPGTADVIDLESRTLLPGFIDSHVHMTFDPPENYAAGVERSVRETEPDRVLRGVANARSTLESGFTTVRNVGGSFADRALRDAIVTGIVPGPRMLVANHSIGITGGHCDPTNALRPEVFGEAPDYKKGVADGPSDARRAVRYQIKHGADVIKICATGGVLSQGDAVGAPQLSLEEMRAVVEEANRAERKVAAHAHGNLGIREAVEAGVHSIEHGSILDQQTVTMMKRRGTVLVPTTYVGKAVVEKADAGVLSKDSAAKAREIAPKMRKSFALAYDSGVVIALGSDAGVFPHGDNGKEFSTMVELGMKPMDAIVAGTSRAAELLGLTDVGVVRKGALADLVVVQDDPLQDITVVEEPVMVVKDGFVYVPPTWAADG